MSPSTSSSPETYARPRPSCLLVDHREDLVRERTGQINRLRWHLHELDPAWDPAPRSLTRFVRLDELAERLRALEGILAWVASDLVARIRESTVAIRELERRIVRVVTSLAPRLLAVPGVGALTAAKIVAEVADVRRFRSKDAFARHNGTAPLPAWSANHVRHRLSRTGNRQLNTALHRIAVTQLRIHEDAQGLPPAEDRDGKHEDGGDQSTQAQALRRRLPDTARRCQRPHLR